MKAKAIAAFLLLVPAVASADFHQARKGRVAVGGSFGGGGMTVDNEVIGCPGCEYEPLAYEVDVHFGSMPTERLAALFEVQLNTQSVDDQMLGVDRLGSAAIMIALQHWVTGPIWVKGGMGFASTLVTKDDVNIRQHKPAGQGWAVMGAAGYEVVSAPHFAVDVQARLITGLGEGIHAGSLGVGINWY
jgi:hypothetical protein